jgi:hypothetical protein
MADLYPLGIWTPWALVLCYDCHGPTFGSRTISAEEMKKESEARVESPEGIPPCKCSECGRLVVVEGRSDVQLLGALRDRLNVHSGANAKLEQTGGMCAAMSLNLGAGSILVTDNEEYEEDAEPSFYICFYRSDRWGEDVAVYTTEARLSEAAEVILDIQAKKSIVIPPELKEFAQRFEGIKGVFVSYVNHNDAAHLEIERYGEEVAFKTRYVVVDFLKEGDWHVYVEADHMWWENDREIGRCEVREDSDFAFGTALEALGFKPEHYAKLSGGAS